MSIEAEATWGIIETGKTAVHYGYYLRISGPSGEEWLGEDRSSLRGALDEAATAASCSGWELIAAGLSPRWVESGLSWNTGFGYWDREIPMHMLDPPPN